MILPDIWLNISPAKTELFLWFTFLDKLPTRDHLFSIGLCPIGSNFCIFCGRFGESTEHILLHCHFSWMVWSFFCKWWGIKLVVPSNLVLLFQQWKSYASGYVQIRFWTCLFYAIVWTLWLHRNEVIFDNSSVSCLRIQKLAFFRVSAWCRAYSPHISITATDLMQSADCIKSCSRLKRRC